MEGWEEGAEDVRGVWGRGFGGRRGGFAVHRRGDGIVLVMRGMLVYSISGCGCRMALLDGV